MKHVYDKRPAQEYDLLIENLQSIVKFPDRIYKNKNGKRGGYVFVKNIKNVLCLCSIEIAQRENDDSRCEVVTFFTVEEDYLAGYELLWEWKGDIPSS